MLDREIDPLPSLPLVESPFFEEVVPHLGLSAEAERVARALHADGVATVDLDLGDVDARRERVAAAIDPFITMRHGKAYDVWRYGVEDARDIAAHPKILSLLQEVYRRAPIPISTINTKRGTEQDFHADGLFRATAPRRYYVTVWVPLEDIDESNGPIVAYPGSHRLPDFYYVDMGLTATSQNSLLEYYEEGYDRLFRRLIDAGRFTPRVYTPKAGQALIWTAGLIHRGAIIRDPNRTRYVQITGYNFAGCLYLTELNSDPYIGKIWLRDVVDVRTGEVAPQTYNGRVLSPEEIKRLRPEGIDRLEQSFNASIGNT